MSHFVSTLITWFAAITIHFSWILLVAVVTAKGGLLMLLILGVPGAYFARKFGRGGIGGAAMATTYYTTWGLAGMLFRGGGLLVAVAFIAAFFVLGVTQYLVGWLGTALVLGVFVVVAWKYPSVTRLIRRKQSDAPDGDAPKKREPKFNRVRAIIEANHLLREHARRFRFNPGVVVNVVPMRTVYGERFGETWFMRRRHGIARDIRVDELRARLNAQSIRAVDDEDQGGLQRLEVRRKDPLKQILNAPAVDTLAEKHDADAPIVLGLDEYGRETGTRITGNFPHLLVGGPSGRGKSVLGAWMIGQLLLRNEAVGYFADGKGGVELGLWKDAVHRFEPDGHDFPSRVCDLLDEAIGEMNRRYQLMARHGHNLMPEAVLDAAYPEPDTPLVVVVIDEVHQATLDATKPRKDAPTWGALVQAKLQNISTRGRAARVGMILMTQSPTVDMVTNRTRLNMSSLMLGRPGRHELWQAVVGDSSRDLMLLARDAPGRFAGVVEGDLVIGRVPFANREWAWRCARLRASMGIVRPPGYATSGAASGRASVADPPPVRNPDASSPGTGTALAVAPAHADPSLARRLQRDHS